jgi:hypothetical protein
MSVWYIALGDLVSNFYFNYTEREGSKRFYETLEKVDLVSLKRFQLHPDHSCIYNENVVNKGIEQCCYPIVLIKFVEVNRVFEPRSDHQIL